MSSKTLPENGLISLFRVMKQKCDTKMKIGEINNDTPVIYAIKKFFGKHPNSYIKHKQLMVLPNEKDMFVFLFDDEIIFSNVFEIDKPMKNIHNPSLFKLEYKTLYSIIPEITDSKTLLHLNQIKTSTFESFNTVILSFKIQRDLFIFMHLIEKHRRIAWQFYFERFIPLPPPHIYQNHYFTEKINRKGKQQERVIVLTDRFIFNIEYSLKNSGEDIKIGTNCLFELKEAKWAIPIECFQELIVQSKEECSLKIVVNQGLGKKIAKKNNLPEKDRGDIDLIFYYVNNFSNFIFNVKRLYFSIKNENLKINIKK